MGLRRLHATGVAMSGTVIWSYSLQKVMSYKPKAIQLKGFEFSMRIDDLTANLMAKDPHDGPRQQQFMVDDANDALRKKAPVFETALKKYDAALTSKEPPDQKELKQLQAELRADLDKACHELRYQLNQIPIRRWKAWVATRKEYSKYKLVAAAGVGASTVGFVASAVGVASGLFTGGVTLVLGIIGLFRSIVSVVQKLDKLWQEAEDVQRLLVASTNNIKNIYDTKGRQALAVHSLAQASFNAVLGSSCMPSLDALQSNSKLWLNKLQGIDVAAGEAAALAVKSLDETEKLEKALQTVKSKEADKIRGELDKLRKLIHKNLDSCHAQSARCNKGRELHAIYDAIIQNLRKEQPMWGFIFDKLIPAASGLALTGASAHQGLLAAHDLLQVAEQCIAIGAGVGKVVKDAVN